MAWQTSIICFLQIKVFDKGSVSDFFFFLYRVSNKMMILGSMLYMNPDTKSILQMYFSS